MWYLNNIFKLKNNNWNEESEPIQKGYQNAQFNFRHFLIWSGSRMQKIYCAGFRGTESGDKVMQFFVGLLRSYLKIKRKPKQLKVMFQFIELNILSVYPFSCWTAFYASVYKLLEHSCLLCPQFPPYFLVLYVPLFNPCLSFNKD